MTCFRRRAGFAAAYARIGGFIAGLGTVAEQPIVRTVDRCVGSTAMHRIADFNSVAVLSVVTQDVVGDVYTAAGGLAA